MGELLEEIRAHAGCYYISDLHTYTNKQMLLDLMSRIKAENYSLKEWYGACSYIFESKKDLEPFHTYDDLKNYLSDKHTIN